MKKLLWMILVLCMWAFAFAGCVEEKNISSESSKEQSSESLDTSSNESSGTSTDDSEALDESFDSAMPEIGTSDIGDFSENAPEAEFPTVEDGEGSEDAEDGNQADGFEGTAGVVTKEEFFQTGHYIQVMYTAYDFFKAYVFGDVETAKLLMDSPDNECLEYFSSQDYCIGSMDEINTYAVELISCTYDADSGNYKVAVHIHFTTEDAIDYMVMTFVSQDVTVENYTYKVWKVSYYDFDA